MRYKCFICGGLFDHFGYRYDSSPRGDDESFCPLCGAVEAGASEVDDDDQDVKLTKEQWENLYDSGYWGAK